MKRTGLVVLLAIGVALPAKAQQTSAAAPAVVVDQKLVGTWDGPYEADHGPPGSIRLVISRDSIWKLAVDLHAGEQVMPSTVRDFKVDGTNLSWSQAVMGMDCKGTAVHAAESVRGELACGHAAIGFLLRKKP